MGSLIQVAAKRKPRSIGLFIHRARNMFYVFVCLCTLEAAEAKVTCGLSESGNAGWGLGCTA